MELTVYNIPDWLQPPKLDRGSLYTDGDMKGVFRLMRSGMTLLDICEAPGMPDYRDLLAFIMENPDLRSEFLRAKADRTHALQEKLLVEAEGGRGEIPNDVSRSALLVKTIMWQMEKDNPDEYGPRQNIEVTHTYDISEAMKKAQERHERLRLERIEKEINP